MRNEVFDEIVDAANDHGDAVKVLAQLNIASVEAGCVGGDRYQTLKNVRAMRDELQALRNLVVDLRVCAKGLIQQRDEARAERDEVKSALVNMFTKCICADRECVWCEYARVLSGVEP